MVQRLHMWPSKDTDQWPAQSTLAQPSISICLAKEQCRQRLVQALGYGTAKMRIETNLVRNKKGFGNDDTQNPLQITLKVCFGARPHGTSWHFVAILQIAMSTKHCEG